MANGQSRVGIGSFLEELQATIGDNTQTTEEPEESLLENITKPQYEIPVLSTYTRLVGKLSKILDAPVERKRKEFAEIYNISEEDVPSAVGGTSLGMLIGQPVLSSIQVTPGDIPPMLAPASGDPETGKYSKLDLGFAGLDVLGAGAILKARRVGEPLGSGGLASFLDYDVAEEMVPLIRQSDMDTINRFRSEVGELDEVGIDDLEGLMSQLSDDTRDVISSRIAGGDVDVPIDIRRKQLIDKGEFKTTGKPEFEHLEDISLESGFNKGVEVFPARGGKYQKINPEELPEGVGLIVQRRREYGQGIDRDIVIGREEFLGTNRFVINSVDPATGKSQGAFKFDLKDYNDHYLYRDNPDPRFKDKKIVDAISWFSGKGRFTQTQKHHNGQLLSDFINFSLENDWVIIERDMSLDSLYALIHQAVRQQAEIIFDASRRSLQGASGGGMHSVHSKIAGSVLVNERGEFVEEGVDRVIRELSEQIDSARLPSKGAPKGRVSGEPNFEVYEDLRPDAPARMAIEARNAVRKRLWSEYPELTTSKEGRVGLAKKIEREIRKIEQQSPHFQTTEAGRAIEYNLIAIKKMGVVLANILGLKGIDELQEFLNYDSQSMESQVFDNEIMF